MERPSVAPEANRLYWESEASVAEISNRLGVSRRALYDMIEPLPSGAECASCGAELHYANRSAKTAAVARCLMCGMERELESDISHEDVGTIPPYDAGWPAVPSAVEHTLRERAIAIAAFAIAGALVGAAATALLRRSR
ncbi:MAG: hypothetical protein ACT443_03095 [Gemmatimonadota bacterium]